MTTVYLAGPMTGLPDYNFPAFTKAAKHLRDQGINVCSPHELHDGDTTQSHQFYMRYALKALLDCDEIALLDGWTHSVGAQLEVYVAATCGMRINALGEDYL